MFRRDPTDERRDERLAGSTLASLLLHLLAAAFLISLAASSSQESSTQTTLGGQFVTISQQVAAVAPARPVPARVQPHRPGATCRDAAGAGDAPAPESAPGPPRTHPSRAVGAAESDARSRFHPAADARADASRRARAADASANPEADRPTDAAADRAADRKPMPTAKPVPSAAPTARATARPAPTAAPTAKPAPRAAPTSAPTHAPTQVPLAARSAAPQPTTASVARAAPSPVARPSLAPSNRAGAPSPNPNIAKVQAQGRASPGPSITNVGHAHVAPRPITIAPTPSPAPTERPRPVPRATRNPYAGLNARLNAMLPHGPVTPYTLHYSGSLSLAGRLEPTPPPSVVARTRFLFQGPAGGGDGMLKMWVVGVERRGPLLICNGWILHFPQTIGQGILTAPNVPVGPANGIQIGGAHQVLAASPRAWRRSSSASARPSARASARPVHAACPLAVKENPFPLSGDAVGVHWSYASVTPCPEEEGGWNRKIHRATMARDDAQIGALTSARRRPDVTGSASEVR